MDWKEEYKANINTVIDHFFREHYHTRVTQNEKILQEAVLYAVNFGDAPRIHTILAMLSYEEVLGLTADPILPVLIGLEFIHTAYSIHADVAGTHNIYHQSGLTTIQKYGPALAVVVGDVLMALGMECLSHGNNMKIIREVLTAIGDTGVMR